MLNQLRLAYRHLGEEQTYAATRIQHFVRDAKRRHAERELIAARHGSGFRELERLHFGHNLCLAVHVYGPEHGLFFRVEEKKGLVLDRATAGKDAQEAAGGILRPGMRLLEVDGAKIVPSDDVNRANCAC